ncbi:MAG: MFS transporter, partial [Actinoplanes sp.]
MRAVLAIRDYRLLLAAGFVSLTGDWILATGLAYQVYVLTGSTLASAGMVLAALLPKVLVGSLAGVYVDRWDRRRTMIVCNLLLAAGLLPLFAVQHAGQAAVVYAVLAVQNAIAAFFVSAEAALVPALVPESLLVTANGLNGQIRDVARLAGAAIGGVLAAWGGITLLAAVDILTFALAAALLLAIRHRTGRPAPAGAARPPHLLHEWTEGLRLIVGHRLLRTLLVFVAITGVGEALMATLMAPFVHDVLHGGAQGYGAILAVQAIGGLAGGLVVTLVGHRFAPSALLGWGAIAFGVLDLALFLYPLVSTALWPALVIMILVGLPGAVTVAGLMTLFQSGAGEAHRGRIFGAGTAVQSATMLAGTLAAGALAERAGIIPVIAWQGVGYCLAGLLFLIMLRPSSAGPSSARPGSAGPSSARPSSAGPSSARPDSARPSSAGPSSARPS